MNYFLLQCKRFARRLPGLLLVGLCLLAGVLAALHITSDTLSGEKDKPVRVALCGNIQGDFLETGLRLMENLDASRFTMELLPMEQEAAEEALSRGEVAAMVIVPKNFLEAAMTGQILPLEFVSTARSSGLVSLFKEEMTHAISQYLLSAQRGVFGIETALREGVLPRSSGADLNAMAIRYAERILIRDRLYAPETLGIGHGLSLEKYLLCGLGILLSALSCLCLGPLLLSGDTGPEKLLICRGASPAGLAARTFLACFLTQTAALLPLLAALVLLGGAVLSPAATLLRLLPALGCVGAASFLLYALSRELTGGLLLQFFGMLGLCFLSGCMYPLYFFPTPVQQAAQWLPTALARSQLAACFTGASFAGEGWALLGWWVLLAGLGILAQSRRYREVRL